MDWQVIILTLGASFITGAVSLIGNIIVSKSNLKKTLIENKEQSKKEYMRRRISIYDSILHRLAHIENNIDDKNVLEDTELERVWLEDYHYCSKDVNCDLHRFFKFYDRKDKNSIKINIENIREQIKKDMDEYYGIKENKKSSRNFF